jgi:hypothetical protein
MAYSASKRYPISSILSLLEIAFENIRDTITPPQFHVCTIENYEICFRFSAAKLVSEWS